MTLIETPVFTRRIQMLLSEEEYRQFQCELVARPEADKVIPGSGGLRKIRWSVTGKGKRGGIRVIYYWIRSEGRILLLFPFAKNEHVDLTRDQLRQLRQIVEEEFS
jgi:mRNA-degrading endonuclease RelE of RelBE toxin-antitoxin system